MTHILLAPRDRRLHQAFEIGVILKGFNALLEIFLGIGLLLPIAGHITTFVVNLADRELIEDPNDFFATHVQIFSHTISPESQFFGSMYLLSHGITKGVLVLGLLRGKMWSYPASIAVLTLFILYQIIRWMRTNSVVLILLTIFDVVVIWLIWREYQRRLVEQRESLEQ